MSHALGTSKGLKRCLLRNRSRRNDCATLSRQGHNRMPPTGKELDKKAVHGAILFLIILGLAACATENDDGTTPLQPGVSVSITAKLVLWNVDTGADRTLFVEKSSTVSRLLQEIPDEWEAQVQDDGITLLPTSDEQGDVFLANISDLLGGEGFPAKVHLLEIDLNGYRSLASKVQIATPCEPCDTWGELKTCYTDNPAFCCGCMK